LNYEIINNTKEKRICQLLTGSYLPLSLIIEYYTWSGSDVQSERCLCILVTAWSNYHI